MHSKAKSTLYGLVAVAGFVFGTTLIGEPLPPQVAQPQAVTPLGEDGSLLSDAVNTAATLRARENTARRLHLTMPYFAVGRLLPLGGES